MSGYVSGAADWASFRTAWNLVLETVPGLVATGFHAKDFFPKPARESEHSPYRRLSPLERLAFLWRLVGVIDAHDLIPVNVAVDIPAFRSFDIDERRFLTGGRFRLHLESGSTKWTSSGAPLQPYFVAFHDFLEAVDDLVDEDATIHFMFDRQKQYQSRASDAFQEEVENREQRGKMGRFRGPEFGKSGEEPPLQAADLLAYVVNSWLSQDDKYQVQPERGLVLDALLRKCNDVRIHSREAMRHLLDLFKADLDKGREPS